MAINLSANTQTTGPVAREVFDSNIGFKSGLQGLARGIGTAADAAGNLAASIKRKNDNAAKQLARTNSSVYTTNMGSAFAAQAAVAKDPYASEESRTAAAAGVAAFDDINYANIDPSGDADESYYKDNIAVLEARRNAYQVDHEVVVNSQRELKAVNQERAGISQFDQSNTGVATTAWAVSEIEMIADTYNPKSESTLGGLANRAPADRELYQSLDQTVTTSISRLTELPTAQQHSELLALQGAITTLSAVGSPLAKRQADSIRLKVASALKTLGKATSKERTEADKVFTAKQVDNAELYNLQVAAATDPLTGIGKPAGDRNGFGSVYTDLPKVATDTEISKHNAAIAGVVGVTASPTGASWIAEAAKQDIEGTPFTGLPPQAFTLSSRDGQKTLWDKSELTKNPEVLKLHTKEVNKTVTDIKNGLAANDFSVLAKIDPAYAKQWKLATDVEVDPSIRSRAWERLQGMSERYRTDPKYSSIFTGVRAFGILPEDNGVSFGQMDDEAKLGYIASAVNLNGNGAAEFAQSLQTSNTADTTVGVLMQLHLDGLAEPALQDASRGATVYGGSKFTFTDKEGEMDMRSASVTAMYSSLQEKNLATPLSTQITAAERRGDEGLASMLRNIETGQIAKVISRNTTATTNEVYNSLKDVQRAYTNSLGHKLISSNGTVISVPPFDTSTPSGSKLNKFFQRSDFFTGGVAAAYSGGVSDALVGELISGDVEVTEFLEMVALSENNPALRQALSGDTVDVKNETEAFSKGLRTLTTDGGLPYVDFSEVQTIDGVDYIIPRFLDQGVDYKAFEKKSGQTLRIPVSKVHDSIQTNLEAKSKFREGVANTFGFLISPMMNQLVTPK
tara:strand:+ start:11969 stop:14527 length:2559 start_codon:yes stop_codon:yes gene_type:complete